MSIDVSDNWEMDKKTLKKICREREMYETPELNEKLYLHHKHFTKIQNLEEYTQVRTLWLQCNILTKIENLQTLTELRCLYLQQNSITKIEGLETLVNLVHLDLSDNRIKVIEGISTLTKLEKINVARNYITTISDCEALTDCPSLIDVDLSRNHIDHFDGVCELLQKMPNLTCFYFHGNEAVRECSQYRKKIIYALPNLRFLDERPVRELERDIARVAMEGGGIEGERLVREAHMNKQKEHYSQLISNNRDEQERYRQRIRSSLDRIKKEEMEEINAFNERYKGDFPPSNTELRVMRTNLKYWDHQKLLPEVGPDGTLVFPESILGDESIPSIQEIQ